MNSQHFGITTCQVKNPLARRVMQITIHSIEKISIKEIYVYTFIYSIYIYIKNIYIYK